MGHFGFVQLIKNYAETTLLIDEKYISQEAFYTAQKKKLLHTNSDDTLSNFYSVPFFSNSNPI